MADDTGRDGRLTRDGTQLRRRGCRRCCTPRRISEVEPLMKTTYERGIEDGIERGIVQGELRLTLRQMELQVRPVVFRGEATGRGVVGGRAGATPDRSARGEDPR